LRILLNVSACAIKTERVGRWLTFLASFLSLRCFAADAFSILWRNRTGVRFDFGSEND